MIDIGSQEMALFETFCSMVRENEKAVVAESFEMPMRWGEYFYRLYSVAFYYIAALLHWALFMESLT
jgi:hypothetical protein